MSKINQQLIKMTNKETATYMSVMSLQASIFHPAIAIYEKGLDWNLIKHEHEGINSAIDD